MNRWKVKRVRLRTGGWGEWAACNDDAPWMYFLTHADALAFADQRARTIEVTLPRVAPHPDYGYLVDSDDPWVYSWDGRWHLAPIGDWDGPAALLCNDVGEYKIHDDELQPLALALLALARRKETA